MSNSNKSVLTRKNSRSARFALNGDPSRTLSFEHLEQRQMLAADVCNYVENPQLAGPMPCEASSPESSQAEGEVQANDRDGLLDRPILSVPSIFASEQNGFAKLTMQLSRASAEDVDVAYQTVHNWGDATAAEDYLPANGVMRIEAGQTEQHIWIALVSDGVAERDERFLVRFDGGQNVLPVMSPGGGLATVTIVDNWTEPGSNMAASPSNLHRDHDANGDAAAPQLASEPNKGLNTTNFMTRAEGEAPAAREQRGENHNQNTIRFDIDRDGKLTIGDALQSIFAFRRTQEGAVATDQALFELDVNLDGQFRLDDVFQVVNVIRAEFQATRGAIGEGLRAPARGH